MTATATSGAPQQRALPRIFVMIKSQHEKLMRLAYTEEGHKEVCARIAQRHQIRGEMVHCLVVSTDLKKIREAVDRGEGGGWQDLFRENPKFELGQLMQRI